MRMPGIRGAGNIAPIVLQQQQIELDRRRQKQEADDAAVRNILAGINTGFQGIKTGGDLYTGLSRLGADKALNAARIQGLDAETARTKGLTVLDPRDMAAKELQAQAEMKRAQRPVDVTMATIGQAAVTDALPKVTPHVTSGNMGPDSVTRIAEARSKDPTVESGPEVYARALDALLRNEQFMGQVRGAYSKKFPTADPASVGFGPDSMSALASSPEHLGAAMREMFRSTPEQDQRAIIEELARNMERGGGSFLGSFAPAQNELLSPLPEVPAPVQGDPWGKGWGAAEEVSGQNASIKKRNEDRQLWREAVLRAAKIYGGADPMQLGPAR